MVKKFSFDFKFLDRFKKKNSEELNSNSYEENNSEDNSDINLNYDSDEEFNLNRKKPEFTSMEELNDSSEFSSVEDSEEFAEKTLSNFQIPDESNEINDLIKQNQEEANFIANEIEAENQEFQELNPPPTPNEAKKFKFNFSNFNTDQFKNFKSGNLKPDLNKFSKVSWNDFVLKIFSPYTRGKIHNTFLVLLVISLTYLLGKTFALFTNRQTNIEIKPKSNIVIPAISTDSTVTDINKITSTNLFNAKESEEIKSAKPKIDISQIHCVEANKPSSKQIKLLDTIVLQDSVKSVASVQMRGGSDLMNIREGEQIEGSEVSKIQRMKLILKNLETGDCEYISSEKDEPVNIANIKILPPSAGKALFKSNNPFIRNVGNNFKIKKSYRDQMITKMSEILTQAKAIQITNPDGSLCFKMTEVVPGSIYTNLNISENDIICQINGRKIDNLNELMGLLGRIKEIDSMQIGLKRNGMTENLEYSFE